MWSLQICIIKLSYVDLNATSLNNNNTFVTFSFDMNTLEYTLTCERVKMFFSPDIKRHVIIQFKQRSVTGSRRYLMDTASFVIYSFWLLMSPSPASPVSLWVNAGICTNTHITASPSHTHTQMVAVACQTGAMLHLFSQLSC